MTHIRDARRNPNARARRQSEHYSAIRIDRIKRPNPTSINPPLTKRLTSPEIHIPSSEGIEGSSGRRGVFYGYLNRDG